MNRFSSMFLLLFFCCGVVGAGETTVLWPSNSNEEDRFGQAVAVSGDLIVIGAPGGTWTSGAAFVFQRDVPGPGEWGEVAVLVSSDAADGDRFGASVAIDGDTVVVGAPHEDTGAPSWGSAYVFRRDAGGPDSWGQVAKLNTSNREVQDTFGWSVGISGDTVVAGAPGEDGVAADSGAVYVFERDLGGVEGWGLAAQLVPQESYELDVFGEALAIDGDTIVVGSPDAYLTGCDCRAGAVWVLDRDPGVPTQWVETTKIENPNDDWYGIFGSAVSMSGDELMIGDSNFRESVDPLGAVYFFRRDQGGADSWGLVRQVVLSSAGMESSRWFGEAVAVSGDVAVAGHSYLMETIAITRRSNGGWGIDGVWNPSQGGVGYGSAVGADGSTVVVGAPDDVAGGDESGTAYVVEVVGDEFVTLLLDDFETGDLTRWSHVDP